MNGILYVAIGGALGASARYSLSLLISKIYISDYPLGTITVNILGSFLMGFIVGWLSSKVNDASNLMLFLGVGLLGGFTTFSTFSLEAFSMYEKKDYGLFITYISSSVFLSIGALILGLILARKVLGT
ncbi:fluoride efflux transporter CrcB [Hellea sp.]|jgi:CrcB protein|nr:fluoride efflux transporter CrcB [Hellea sp.]MDA8887935.1 fluoride efflux transporter CrcB [Hellea sp.]MDA8997015.1 fluoride efflux transporter CrcB [Hellea sp.]MDB4845260.1 fluoride efflux transporter CrcB [Hellea sp.]MDC0422341.1 fluoride efflux transporter CrcB [Hellea sp.]MDC0650789.1 fluoride efflux transporter CrcB [Hellea sp.]